MNRIQNDIVTPSQITAIIVGTIVGVGILGLPYALVKAAHQDGWISAAIGAVYPLYMVFLATFMSRKHPKENILSLSKKYLGKFIGTIFNVLFMLFFLLYTAGVTSGFSNVIRVYIVSFLSPIKVIVVAVSLALYISYKGLKVIGRVNEIIHYLNIVLVFIPVFALKYGSLLNISPVFGSGVKNIAKASLGSIISYGGMEILFLIYPYINDIKKVKSASLKAVAIIVFFYTWLTFITIYFLGPDIVLKNMWPTIVATESIRIPAISTFRFIFMFLWSIAVFRVISNFYFSTVYTLQNIIKKVDIKVLDFIIYPIVIYLSLKLGDEITRRKILDTIIPWYTLIVVISISLICLLILIKSGGKNENKKQNI